jgi:hypothetical protein
MVTKPERSIRGFMVSRTNSRALLALVAAVAALSAIIVGSAGAQGPSINAGPQAGTVWARGLATAAAHAAHTTSPNLVYHGGAVVASPTKVQPIFWGTSWPSYRGDEVDGINSFYGGVGGTSYLGTNVEYTQAGGGHVSTSLSAAAAVVDASTAPARAPQTSEILAEVARLYPNPTVNGYYPVYVDQPRGHAGYCAWHSAGTINGTPVTFAFFFKLDGDPGCDPQGSGAGSEGLKASVNVSGHELSEMLTDPQLNAWYDSKGAENADKCAWTFGSRLLRIGSSSYRIQGNWSNNAYDSGAGYTDASAGVVRGCIDGTNN